MAACGSGFTPYGPEMGRLLICVAAPALRQQEEDMGVAVRFTSIAATARPSGLHARAQLGKVAAKGTVNA
jgi:hypothetical protein